MKIDSAVVALHTDQCAGVEGQSRHCSWIEANSDVAISPWSASYSEMRSRNLLRRSSRASASVTSALSVRPERLASFSMARRTPSSTVIEIFRARGLGLDRVAFGSRGGLRERAVAVRRMSPSYHE